MLLGARHWGKPGLTSLHPQFIGRNQFGRCIVQGAKLDLGFIFVIGKHVGAAACAETLSVMGKRRLPASGEIVSGPNGVECECRSALPTAIGAVTDTNSDGFAFHLVFDLPAEAAT